jgi:hypothetical protein
VLSFAEPLVESYLQQKQYERAIAIAQALPLAGEGHRLLLRIATAYQRDNQPELAAALVKQTVTPLLKPRVVENADYGIATEAIALAQAGGLEPATWVAEQLSTATTPFRARLWFVIAGEARQRNQSDLAAKALGQFIAAGQQGKKEGFGGFGFGDQRDYEWTQVLYPLSRDHGYEPEMMQFIQQLQLESEGAEFLIDHAIRTKRFDQAKALVPIPMMRAIDAGVFEVQDNSLPPRMVNLSSSWP